MFGVDCFEVLVNSMIIIAALAVLEVIWNGVEGIGGIVLLLWAIKIVLLVAAGGLFVLGTPFDAQIRRALEPFREALTGGD